MKLQFEMKDISAEVFGKYRDCRMAKDGMWYADSDFDGFSGKPRKGALPAPQQDTPELQRLALDMHERAADKAANAAVRKALGRRGLPPEVVALIFVTWCVVLGLIALAVWWRQ